MTSHNDSEKRMNGRTDGGACFKRRHYERTPRGRSVICRRAPKRSQNIACGLRRRRPRHPPLFTPPPPPPSSLKTHRGAKTTRRRTAPLKCHAAAAAAPHARPRDRDPSVRSPHSITTETEDGFIGAVAKCQVGRERERERERKGDENELLTKERRHLTLINLHFWPPAPLPSFLSFFLRVVRRAPSRCRNGCSLLTDPLDPHTWQLALCNFILE